MIYLGMHSFFFSQQTGGNSFSKVRIVGRHRIDQVTAWPLLIISYCSQFVLYTGLLSYKMYMEYRKMQFAYVQNDFQVQKISINAQRSYALVNAESSITYSSINITFQFKTTTQDGVLFYSSAMGNLIIQSTVYDILSEVAILYIIYFQMKNDQMYIFRLK